MQTPSPRPLFGTSRLASTGSSTEESSGRRRQNPDWRRLYLAGPDAATVAALWEGSNLDARVLSGAIGSASALKAAYAGWTKGSAALLLAVRAYAEANGLGEEIVAEWETSIPGLAERAEGTASRIGRKAWRFEGEMAEIAAAMEDVGLPGGFHDAAREIYRRLSDLKGIEEQSVEDVNRRILGDVMGEIHRSDHVEGPISPT